MQLTHEEKILIDRMLGGDRSALARLITYAESRHDKLPEILKSIGARSGESYIVGITGPPGAGKSTLTSRLTAQYRRSGKKIGVLAVDPSSPFSGGSILGDRIRMQEHSMDDDVFIRSISSRGTHGGISRATKEIIKLYQAYGMDYIIVETVGVGQTELDIIVHSDTVVVVLVPEAGDTVQTMKAGLMEIADIFVVNKADREGAALLSAELKDTVSIRTGMNVWEIPVLLTSAVNDTGISELIGSIENHRVFQIENGLLPEKRAKRREEEFSQIVQEYLERKISEKLNDGECEKISDRVRSGELDPYEAARQLIDKII